MKFICFDVYQTMLFSFIKTKVSLRRLISDPYYLIASYLELCKNGGFITTCYSSQHELDLQKVLGIV